MSATGFVTLVGYGLGVLIVMYCALVYTAPIKMLFYIGLNSFLGCVFLSVANACFKDVGIFVGINPLTAVCTGVLGIPGTIAVIILSYIL